MAKNTTETNPFVQSLVIPGFWKLETGDEDSSEGGSGFTAHVRLVDKDVRCQIFPAHLLMWFKDLPTSAKDMVIWITLHIAYNSDVVEIREDKYCEEMGISRSTFFSAKTAITNRLIVLRASRKNTYWVNPSYLFKGNRIKVFRANVVEENENPLKGIH
jgi:hypothetical protein